ncbi:MAG: DNA-formamidopyrimidine glycosylase family protein [bacterium]
MLELPEVETIVNGLQKQIVGKKIVSRFKEFSDNPKIQCHSIPLESESDL